MKFLRYKRPTTLKSMRKRAAKWANWSLPGTDPAQLHSICDLNPQDIGAGFLADHLLAGGMIPDTDIFLVSGTDTQGLDGEGEGCFVPPEWTEAEAERMKREFRAEL